MEDLSVEITKWHTDNENAILMVDLNEDVASDNITSFFYNLQLEEAITDRHATLQGIQPTYQRGSRPIDGIFMSQHLEIQAGGYLPFGAASSDHRAIWIKVDFDKRNHLTINKQFLEIHL